jgi:hypothetical protein
MQLRDDILPNEVVLDQFPKRFSTDTGTFNVVYTPIRDGDKLERRSRRDAVCGRHQHAR